MPHRITFTRQITQKDKARFMRHTSLSETSSYNRTPCLEWTGFKDVNGYGGFQFEGYHIKPHRFAYAAKHGEWPTYVLHHCDNRACVNVKHLYSGTQSDNMQDMIRRGRANRLAQTGSRNHYAKRTENEIIELRKIIDSKLFSDKQIANAYKMAQSGVGQIRRRTSWKHI